MRSFAIVVALDDKQGIGKANALPWRLARDMQRFKDVTIPAPAGRQNAVVMGRKTWDSLPPKYRPLPGRLNVVLTSNPDLALPSGVLRAGSLDHALTLLTGREDVGDVFIIGGGVVFSLAIRHKDCCKIFLTRVTGDFSCDVFFPLIGPDFIPVKVSEEFKEESISFCFIDLVKC